MTRRHLLLDSPFPCCFSALVGDQLEGCPSSHIASSWPKLTISWDCQLSPRPTTCLTCCPSWCSCSPAPPAPALSFNWCSSSSKSAALLLTHVLRQVCCCCSVFAAAHCDQLLPFKYVVSRVWGRASCSTFQARQAGRRHVPARSTESSGSAIRIVKLGEPVGWRETRSFRGVVFLLTGTRHNLPAACSDTDVRSGAPPTPPPHRHHSCKSCYVLQSSACHVRKARLFSPAGRGPPTSRSRWEPSELANKGHWTPCGLHRN